MAPGLPARRVVVVTDETVAPLHLGRLEAALDDAGIRHDAIVVPAGEGSKGTATLERVLDRLLDLGIERSVAVVALGGGVVGRLAGFAPAVALRVLAFLHIPPTLHAHVHSDVGQNRKTA